jgi:sulfoquinovose isomerase
VTGDDRSGSGGPAGSGTAGSGTAGSGTAGSGTAGSGTAGSGTAGSGTAGSGTAGSGTAGSGTAELDPAAPAHAAWLRDQVSGLLDFCAASADWRGGGFDGLTGTGRRAPGPKQLYVTARMTYGYALGAMLGYPGCEELAGHGLRALRTIFRDDANGGWYAELAEDGREVRVARKQTYGHAFVLLATSVAGQAGLQAGDLASEAAQIFDRWLYREPDGMCVDSWDQGFGECDPYRGINANMHAVEAFLGAYCATGQPPFLRRAQSIARRLAVFAAGAHWRVPEHFSADWQPQLDYNADMPYDGFRPFGATPGHGLEWARLLLQLRLAGGDDDGSLLAAAEALFGRAVGDAWDPDRCGLAYTVDWQGREVAKQRLHWPLAEAIGAVRYLHAATGRPGYARWYATFWRLADRCFIDRQGGSWWHELGPDGRPAGTIWTGKSDLYHALNACLFSLLPPAASIPASIPAGLAQPG